MGRSLYPPIEPYSVSYLKVSDLHEICYEEAGNPEGRPAVFLHGGPGAGIVPIYRQVFNPKLYRIVLPDQRGAGRSRPHGELRENTTWDLVADLERLREHLRIPRWMVVGGSWGGTLALAYAQAYPDSVSAMILRGTWLARQRDLDWQTGSSGAAQLYPQEYHDFVSYIPPGERDDVVAAYLERLASTDPVVANAAAQNWGRWESCKISLDPRADLAGRSFEDVAGDYLHMAKFEALYEHKRAWLKRDCQLLEDMPRIAHIPGVVICGRYDTITPPESSWAIAERWPAAELKLVPATGHAFFEAGIIDAHVTATDHFGALPGPANGWNAAVKPPRQFSG
jgi:proline iminopeptidase